MTNGQPDSILELPEDEADAIRAEAYIATHDRCLQCNGRVCVSNDDGTNDCACGTDFGQVVRDEHGPVGVVHDDCRERFTIDCLVHDVEQSLRVRLPLGMEPWAAERSRNIVTKLLGEYDIKLKARP